MSRNALALRIGALTVLMLVATFAGWSRHSSQAASLPQVVQPGDVTTPTATFTIILVPTATPTVTPAPDSQLDESLMAPVGLHGAQDFSTYTVRAGDTLLDVALEVGVDVEELPCAVAPTFRPDQPLVIGDQLDVPPPGWHCHQVEADESLTQIAARYGVDPTQIIEVAWNRLDAGALGDKALEIGSFVRIPSALGATAGDGFMAFMLDQPLTVSPMTAYAIGGPRVKSTAMIGPVPKDWPYGSGNFMWPVFGWMSQGSGEDHRAIDIAAPSGTFVTAADRGVVMRSGWNEQGYGMFVVIDHNIDYITLYAHLTDVFVKEGDIVAQGQIVGTIGSSGNSTGPHLHFEIRDFGRRANPLDFLTH